MNMNDELALQQALQILQFELDLANFTNHHGLAFNLKYAVGWLRSALEVINPVININSEDIPEFHNLQEMEHKQPLLLRLHTEENGVTVSALSPKEKVANYLEHQK